MLGYSAYLHPVGDGLLIGVGQDATETGSRTGLQVALYDVKDPAAPTRVAQAVLPGAGSDAEWEHHAFLWWPDTGLIAIPMNSYTDTDSFQGLVGFHADTAGNAIGELGRVEHPVIDDAADGSVKPYEGDVVAPDIPGSEYRPPIERSFVIGDKLWTLSASSLGVSDLATLGQTSIIPLA
jgi:hypothetical protein